MTRFSENSHLGRKVQNIRGGPGPRAPQKGAHRARSVRIAPWLGGPGAARPPPLLFFSRTPCENWGSLWESDVMNEPSWLDKDRYELENTVVAAMYQRLVETVIAGIKSLPDNCRQSGEDSNLTDVWEEFKYQLQE